MGLFSKFGSNQAVKLINHYTGEVVSPDFVCTCDADISPDWRGVIVLERNNLWLVNRLGARGIQLDRLEKGPMWGQFPPGTRGYPKYGFMFFMDSGNRFSVYPITEEDGRKLQELLKNRMNGAE